MTDPATPPLQHEVVPTEAGYDRWAEFYDGDDNPLVLLEEEHIGPLLGDVAGLDVADVGCGTGRHTLRLAAADARVTAVDFSAVGLAKGAKLAEGRGVSLDWVEADLREYEPAPGGYDLVLIAYIQLGGGDFPALLKTAAGALAHLPVVRVANVNRALEELKRRGYWIYGLDERGPAGYDEVDYASPTVFVLGGEGRGLHEQTAKHCDFLVKIPMPHGGVASLNVSVAAGIVLFEWRRKLTDAG